MAARARLAIRSASAHDVVTSHGPSRTVQALRTGVRVPPRRRRRSRGFHTLPLEMREAHERIVEVALVLRGRAQDAVDIGIPDRKRVNLAAMRTATGYHLRPMFLQDLAGRRDVRDDQLVLIGGEKSAFLVLSSLTKSVNR